jgi:hypothetical protein
MSVRLLMMSSMSRFCTWKGMALLENKDEETVVVMEMVMEEVVGSRAVRVESSLPFYKCEGAFQRTGHRRAPLRIPSRR